jgi:uncharacterized protein YoxC
MKLLIIVLLQLTMALLFFYIGLSINSDSLTKEIDRLKPYEEMFKVMADSVMDRHEHCFRLGE